VRAAAVLVLVSAVLGASALDLTLGALWVAALLGVLLLRRRLRLAAPLVLVASAGLIVWGLQLGWFTRPAPAPYEKGWLPDWSPAGSPAGGATDPRVVAARDHLVALRREELRLTGPELEQRAGAVLRLARRLDVVRGQAPGEVVALEGAARRLARTLAAPEFRNLEARRAAVSAHLLELERRLVALRDGSEAAEVLRAADPAAMAHVSLRPVREDLAAANTAVIALVRALGGGLPSTTVTATARYDESRGEVGWEVRHDVSGARLRLVRIETRAFRGAGPSGRPLSLAYAAEEEPPRPMPSGDWLELGSAARHASIVAAWTEPAVVRAIRSTFRPVAFERLEIRTSRQGDDAVVATVVDGHPGIEMPLAVPLPPPVLERVTLPRHALYFGGGPGVASSGPGDDAWIPVAGGVAPIELDLVPRALLLRTRALARLRPYVYRPNPMALTVLIGLGALTLVLMGRRRSAAPGTG
jgi:hypothetical protein